MFITMEMQTMADGSFGVNKWTFDTIPEAEAKYYTLLSVAALSSVYIHTAMIIDPFGTCLTSKSYTHEQPTEEQNV